jgi:hypothetical protein
MTFSGQQWPWFLDVDHEGNWHVLRDAQYSYVSDACVEGTTEEWLEIADALRKRESVSFKRCSVRWSGDTFTLCSPRNTMGRPARLSGYAKADELADIISNAITEHGND